MRKQLLFLLLALIAAKAFPARLPMWTRSC